MQIECYEGYNMKSLKVIIELFQPVTYYILKNAIGHNNRF